MLVQVTSLKRNDTIPAIVPENIPANSQVGHRDRLRDKFLRAGLSSLNDYEVVELLLTLGSPRINCKDIGKDAIKHFKGLRGVLDATAEELQEVKGIGPKNAIGIRLVREVANQYLKEKVKELPDCSSPSSVKNYLFHEMQGLKKELFKVLFLDSRNRLIEAEDLFQGTVNMSAVFTREVVSAALKHHAAAVICVHNHPSGNTSPSKEDREITRELAAAMKLVGVSFQDHIIVGDHSLFSFAGEGLLNRLA